MSHQRPNAERAARAGRIRPAAAITAATVAAATVIATTPATALAPPVATQLDIVGPDGSEVFGEIVVVLSNGNFVVTDPGFDEDGVVDVGAVYLYDGTTNELISRITGSSANDRVGDREPIEVGDGNVVFGTRHWDFGAVVDAGAVTFMDGETGIDGEVGPSNSLHGTSPSDNVSLPIVLANGNYVVRTPDWDDGAVTNVGAVTFADGDAGVTGPITTTNSLYGTTAGDRIGANQVLALANGNYVVNSPNWDFGAVANAGASTLGNGQTGTTGPVTAANSLHGTTANDAVGGSSYEVGSSDYVVSSGSWDAPGPIPNVGAITWADGDIGVDGPVTTANSLYGSTANDQVGNSGVWTLANGNYVVGSQTWDLVGIPDVGAATWAPGETGLTGPVTPSNSLHGTTAGDAIATNGVAALTNGNYVVNGGGWDFGAIVNAGASTWGDGTVGITGPVTTTNSLHGTSPNEGFGRPAVLTNGNYVVPVTGWDDGATPDVGAAVWVDGAVGITGPVTTINSLHGTSPADKVGGIKPLPDGNYVVISRDWDDGATPDVGAVTLADGDIGTFGPVTTTNSLHGTTVEDRVGSDGIVVLADGNFVVNTPKWDLGTAVDVGAVTWVDAATGLVGPVTADNSLHGTTAADQIGTVDDNGFIVALPDGRYAVPSESWDDDTTADAGAITVGRMGGAFGPVTAQNSAIGTPPGLISEPVDALTAGDAIVVETFQNRVILVLSDLLSLAPARLLDTRSGPGNTTVDGLALGWGRVAPDTFIEVRVAGRGGVPANATTATLNLASITPSSAGFATLYPCTDDVPTAASLNYGPGQNVSNTALVTLSPTGTICIFSSAEAHYALDVVAYTPAGSKVGTLVPGRLLDTRSGPDISTVDGASLGAGRLIGDASVEVQVSGRGGVPADASTAVLNIAAIFPSEPGFATLYPCSETPPLVSSLNYGTDTISNTTTVRLSATGTVCLFTSSEADYALDVVGFVPPGSNVTTLDPARFLDTRSGSGSVTVDGVGEGGGPIAAGAFIEIEIAARGSVPAGARSALVNLASVAPAAPGFATLYPCTADVPTASSLNYRAANNISNATLVRLSDTGSVCIFTAADAHYVLDVLGYVE